VILIIYFALVLAFYGLLSLTAQPDPTSELFRRDTSTSLNPTETSFAHS